MLRLQSQGPHSLAAARAVARAAARLGTASLSRRILSRRPSRWTATTAWTASVAAAVVAVAAAAAAIAAAAMTLCRGRRLRTRASRRRRARSRPRQQQRQRQRQRRRSRHSPRRSRQWPSGPLARASPGESASAARRWRRKTRCALARRLASRHSMQSGAQRLRSARLQPAAQRRRPRLRPARQRPQAHPMSSQALRRAHPPTVLAVSSLLRAQKHCWHHSRRRRRLRLRALRRWLVLRQSRQQQRAHRPLCPASRSMQALPSRRRRRKPSPRRHPPPPALHRRPPARHRALPPLRLLGPALREAARPPAPVCSSRLPLRKRYKHLSHRRARRCWVRPGASLCPLRKRGLLSLCRLQAPSQERQCRAQAHLALNPLACSGLLAPRRRRLELLGRRWPMDSKAALRRSQPVLPSQGSQPHLAQSDRQLQRRMAPHRGPSHLPAQQRFLPRPRLRGLQTARPSRRRRRSRRLGQTRSRISRTSRSSSSRSARKRRHSAMAR